MDRFKIFNMNKILVLLLIVYGTAVFSQDQNTAVQSYEESQDVIANPERGFQKYSITNSDYYSSTGYTNLDETTLTNWRTGTDKVTVIFRYFLLDAFLEGDISSLYLNNIQNDFDQIRNCGLKCIVRFSYSNAQSEEPQQPQKSQIISHINQLAPVLEANRDVILTHQAGFLGTWGEWYYTNSSEFGTDGSISTEQWANRKDVIDAMLQNTPEDISVQVRYPEVKKTLYGETPLDSSKAFQNTPNARIGFFNDAFLNTWGDMGTYSVSGESVSPVGGEDYTYLANETRYVPMSGETNGLNPPRTDGENAVFELDSTNWSTLNRDYYTANFDNWITSGHYNDILKGLGYRFVLISSSFTKSDKQLHITLELKNTGFAGLFKKRTARLVLIDSLTSEKYLLEIDSDPRYWEADILIDQVFDISAIPQGSYDSYISLTDPDSSLSLRPEYSIRFANNNIWDETLGYNRLNQKVEIDETGVQAVTVHDKIGTVRFDVASKQIIINHNLQKNGQIRFSLFNSKGQVIKTLLKKVYPDNSANLTVNLSGLNNGLYFYKVESGKVIDFNKLIIVK